MENPSPKADSEPREKGCDRPEATSTVGKMKEHIHEFINASTEDHKMWLKTTLSKVIFLDTFLCSVRKNLDEDRQLV